MSLMLAHNLEDMAEGIGKLKGMSIGMSQKKYMHVLLTHAFNKANTRFNFAAAEGAEKLNIKHMFEYNSDVNEGGPPGQLQSSRLWRTTFLGGGGHKRISYVFLPQKSPRTELLEEEAGVKQDILNKLRVNNGTKYYWRNKAENTENMKYIYIKPREAPALFIPTIQGLNDATEEEEKQGFGWRKAYANIPGEWTGGGNAFTRYFWEYWSGPGAKDMEASMVRKFNADVKKFGAALNVTPSKPKPAKASKISPVVEANSAKTAKQWTVWAIDESGDMKVVS